MKFRNSIFVKICGEQLFTFSISMAASKVTSLILLPCWQAENKICNNFSTKSTLYHSFVSDSLHGICTDSRRAWLMPSIIDNIENLNFRFHIQTKVQFLFVSLHPPVTKNQMPIFFCFGFFCYSKKRQLGIFSFFIAATAKIKKRFDISHLFF